MPEDTNAPEQLRADVAALAKVQPASALREPLRAVMLDMCRSIEAGRIPFGPWERRCLISAVEHLRRRNNDVALAQLAALLGDTRRRRALAWMPDVPDGTLSDVLRDLGYRPAADGVPGTGICPAT
ncbi:MAG: hypothetical protein U1E23_15585 [Reyranellaceae bacterium]